MEISITATGLARRIGDILGRIRYRGDTFVVERNGVPVARILPVPASSGATLADALGAWRAAGEADPEFADALERVGTLDRPTLASRAGLRRRHRRPAPPRRGALIATTELPPRLPLSRGRDSGALPQRDSPRSVI